MEVPAEIEQLRDGSALVGDRRQIPYPDALCQPLRELSRGQRGLLVAARRGKRDLEYARFIRYDRGCRLPHMRVSLIAT